MTEPLRVLAPVPGVVIALDGVPDPVFAGSLVGPGLAIDPHREGEVEVLAPISGSVFKLHPHAFVVLSPQGRGVLVHLGIDTVQLGGEGFTLHVAEKDDVVAGQLICTWEPAMIAAGGRSVICPVVALDGSGLEMLVAPEDVLDAGDPLFDWG